MASLIHLDECRVGPAQSPLLTGLTWDMRPGECWVVTGPNGGGKSAFAAALAGELSIVPARGASSSTAGDDCRNVFASRATLVSFEQAAAVIERERANDDSDFVEGGIDPGTTVRSFIARALPDSATLPGSSSRREGGDSASAFGDSAHTCGDSAYAFGDSAYAFGDSASACRAIFPEGEGLETHPAVLSCGIVPILDRGLRLLSTGEIRRALLARALASEPALLVLDEPYEGLDAATRIVLAGILERLAARTASMTRGTAADLDAEMTAESASDFSPVLVLVADRWERIPAAVNRVVELADRRVAFAGERADYERMLALRSIEAAEEAEAERPALLESLAVAESEASALAGHEGVAGSGDRGALVELRNVTVGWSGRKVLDSLSWTVRPGEHWLVRGPNGSGKTTLLELITGDNPQAFCNDVRLFGRRRGTGETVWEIKARMGLVSYRLHLEYRYLDDASLEEVLVSGLHDSIGLYVEAGDAQVALARHWLSIAGFSGRGRERFGHLSFGEQRAILVARAAVKSPPLLVLDEPCHGLDAAHRRRVLDLLGAIAGHGRSTLIHVTHDPDEVLACERRILELRPGREPSWAVLGPD